MGAELKPEVRLDKTGKAVTRHVRASETTAKSGVPIPGPRTTSSSTKQGTLSNVLTELLVEPGWETEYLGNTLSKAASVKALKLMQAHISSLPHDARLRLRDNFLYAHGTLFQVPLKVKEKTFLCLSATAMTAHQFAENQDAQFVLDAVQSAMTTARSAGYRCDAATINDDSELLNLLVLEQIVVGERKPTAPIEGAIRDALWFATHMNELAPHARIILERKSIERTYCEELLASGAIPAISDGFL